MCRFHESKKEYYARIKALNQRDTDQEQMKAQGENPFALSPAELVILSYALYAYRQRESWFSPEQVYSTDTDFSADLNCQQKTESALNRLAALGYLDRRQTDDKFMYTVNDVVRVETLLELLLDTNHQYQMNQSGMMRVPNLEEIKWQLAEQTDGASINYVSYWPDWPIKFGQSLAHVRINIGQERALATCNFGDLHHHRVDCRIHHPNYRWLLSLRWEQFKRRFAA